MAPLTQTSPEVIAWKKEGKAVKLEKNGKRRTGGWARVMPDIEWFVKRESELARGKGKKLFLHGFSMVSEVSTLGMYLPIRSIPCAEALLML